MNVARHSSLLFHSSTKTAKDIETTTVPRVGFTAVGQEAAADFNSRPVLEKDVILCCFAPKGGFYFQCADGSAIWSNLPPSLHQKLYKRNQNLPRLISLSVSDTQDWLVIFQDGSFATSGFSLSPKLRSCLANDDSTPILFKFGPHQAWVLVRADGTVESERLPTGLDMLLKRRSKFDAPIKDLQINSFGGWFLRFLDGESEWECIPQTCEKLLISNLRKLKPQDRFVMALSLSEGLSYFCIAGDNAGWVVSSNCNLKESLDFLQEKPGAVLSDTVTWEPVISRPNSAA